MTREIQKNGLNWNMNSIWTIIYILTGCNLFTRYLKNWKISLKIIGYLKSSLFEPPFEKCNILLSLEKLNSKELYLIQLICQETLKKYVCSRFPSFFTFPLPPCSPLFVFEHPPPQIPSFWLELTLSTSISILLKFREKKLIMNTSIFGWAQRVF